MIAILPRPAQIVDGVATCHDHHESLLFLGVLQGDVGVECGPDDA